MFHDMDATIRSLPKGALLDIAGVGVMTYTLTASRSEALGEVVFCHGTPWSAPVWANAAHYLSVGYRVFLWDMPGYGASTKDSEVPVDLPSQMSRFAQLLDRWGLERPYVVAHDIGGAVALGAHLLHQRDYASLYLWDVVALEPWGSSFFRLVADHDDVFASLPAELHAALVKQYISGASRRQLGQGWIDTLSRPWLDQDGQAAFYRQIAALRTEHTHSIVEHLSQLRCRVAIGWGCADPWLPAEQATRLQQALPGTPPLTMLEEIGHLAPVEAPAQVRSAINTWLAAPREETPPHR